MATASGRHVPVLEQEALEALQVRENGTYLDATLGRAGHTRAILARLGAGGRLFAMDRDPDAIQAAGGQFAGDRRVKVYQSRFSRMDGALSGAVADSGLDGILMDLGVSSPQLDDASRGFSFMRDAPLDMRMDPASGASAASWLAAAGEKDIADVIKRLGEERFARRIATAIVAARRQRPIETTGQLAAIVDDATPRKDQFKHPATRTFQAIRMFINQELEELTAALPKTLKLLREGGRLVVISFHSLEDRIVKRFIRDHSRADDYPRRLPVPAALIRPRLRRIGGKTTPSAEEIHRNPRARSAVMRVAERTGEACV